MLAIDIGSEETMGQRRSAADSFGNTLSAQRHDLVRFARTLTSNTAEADDLVQEALLKALSARVQFRQGTNLPGWVRSILRNHFFDERRRPQLHLLPKAQLNASEEIELEEQEDVLDLLSMDDLLEALPKMKPIDRQIIVLADLDKRSYRDIGRQLGVHVSTIGSRLFRARRRLRERLELICDLRRRARGTGVRVSLRRVGDLR